MALLIKNICLSDITEALQLAQSDFPQFNVSSNAGNSLNLDRYISSSSINMNTGVFTYSTRNSQNTVLTTNSTVTFPQCTDENLPFAVQDMLFGLALVFIFFITFNAGMKR